MPMSDWAYGDDAWHLVHFVRSLSSDAQRARVEMKKFRDRGPPRRRACPIIPTPATGARRQP